jgi:hypothetical protein
MPNQNTVPNQGKKCGRRERESRREGRREQSFRDKATPSRDVTVKGIPVFGKAAFFAGRRRNEDLGRSVLCRGYPPATGDAPVTADVRRAPRRGTTSRMRHKAHAPDAKSDTIALCFWDASFTRSFDPCALILTTHGGRKIVVVRRSSRYHGWANPSRDGRNQHWDRNERTLRGSPHATLDASRGRGVFKKRKEVEASVPARIKSSGLVARTSLLCCRSR